MTRTADAVVEAMRPRLTGSVAASSSTTLRLINPRIVFCTISGYGMVGPYRDYPSHGVAYDTWAGIVNVATDEEGFSYIPEHASIGIHAGPLFGALGILAAVLRANATGEGSYVELAQSDAAAAMDWLRSETYKAYERPESEVTGNKSDNFERRAPGTAGMVEGVRYQVYEAADHKHVLFMASERAFWENFCQGVDRMDLFERWPGSQYADHARGNRELQPRSCATSSAQKHRWSGWSSAGRSTRRCAPVNTPKTLLEDPQFADRFPLLSAQDMGSDQLFTPLHFVGEKLPPPAKAPTAGQHTEDVLRTVLGYDDAQVAEARKSIAFGPDESEA